jgi:hypothetical protein
MDLFSILFAGGLRLEGRLDKTLRHRRHRPSNRIFGVYDRNQLRARRLGSFEERR